MFLGIKLNTRFKLQEAQYFLERLQHTTTEPKINYFYLSAFLAAWRSVPDVLLYDLADYYGLINYIREKNPPPLNQRIDRNSFWYAADASKNSQVLECFEWWREKMKEVNKMELANERIVAVHKGLHPQTIFLPPIVLDDGHFSLRNLAYWRKYEGKMADVIEKCSEGFSKMESMVNEAERKFNINLSAREK